MKQAIRVRGWISTANLINPRKLFTDELPRYYLAIQPEDSIVFDELKDHVDQRRLEVMTRYSPNVSHFVPKFVKFDKYIVNILHI